MIKGGRNLVSATPVFSNDAKKLLVCTGNSISIFSTSTGLQMAELEGHTALVTSVIVVPALTPSNKILCFCWTSSLDGTIRYWDFSLPELMKTVDIRMPIFSMVIPRLLSQATETDGKPPNLFAYLSVENAKLQDDQMKVHGQILKCNLTKCRLTSGVILAQTQLPESITIGSSGKFFGIRNRRKLHVWEVIAHDHEAAPIKRITLHHTKNLTVFAFHPTERIVAAGDVTGRILIWRSFGSRTFSLGGLTNGRAMDNEDERPGVRGDDDADSCATWHWHSAEVKVLAFSSDGAYLYSGGKEGVLVVWQLDTGKKKFLPRIGSPLLYFTTSLDPSLSSVSCVDNRIHLLKMPSMEILKSISGIKIPYSFPEIYEGLYSRFIFDQTAGLVALRTENYCIQFYSLFDDRENFEVQICERNHQPSDDLTVVVTLMALSPDGSLMSTAETKLPEEGLGGLVCLKFWTSGLQSKGFSLSTIIYEPHRDAGISAITFHPTRAMAVSASYGGDFKIWAHSREIQEREKMPQNSGWTCHAVGSFKKKPMTAAAFSADGSVLAIAAETVVTIWDPEKNVLVAVIGETLEPITMLSFIGKSEYLLSASRGSKSQLSLWSLSKVSVSWSYKLQVEAVACAVDISYFAVLARLPQSSKCTELTETKRGGRDGVILLFKEGEPIPVTTWSVKKAKGGGLAFIQADSGFFKGNVLDRKLPPALLAYINGDHEYVLFNPYNPEVHDPGMAAQEYPLALEDETVGKFGYTSIYGELPKFDMKRNETEMAPVLPSEKPWETIFSGSSHNLPPITKLCTAFLESLLEKRSSSISA